jgi:hypothetical protein
MLYMPIYNHQQTQGSLTGSFDKHYKSPEDQPRVRALNTNTSGPGLTTGTRETSPASESSVAGTTPELQARYVAFLRDIDQETPKTPQADHDAMVARHLDGLGERDRRFLLGMVVKQLRSR